MKDIFFSYIFMYAQLVSYLNVALALLSFSFCSRLITLASYNSVA